MLPGATPLAVVVHATPAATQLGARTRDPVEDGGPGDRLSGARSTGSGDRYHHPHTRGVGPDSDAAHAGTLRRLEVGCPGDVTVVLGVQSAASGTTTPLEPFVPTTKQTVALRHATPSRSSPWMVPGVPSAATDSTDRYHHPVAGEHSAGVFDSGRRQVFIADDAFGSTEYRPDAAERWALGLGRLFGMLDDQHWLVWTSRPAPLKAGLRRVQRERGSERFPAPGEVLVDASALDLAEKTLILFRHARARRVNCAARALLRSNALAIVEHPHFTPERIRRLVSDQLEDLPSLAAHDDKALVSLVELELASPTEAMRNSFRALAGEYRDLLIALLDAPAGLVDERELAATIRRHHAGGLSRPPSELIDRLTDHFLRSTPLGIGWVHPSWRDLVIDELRSDSAARERFVACCGIDGVRLALSAEGGASGERVLPLLVTDSDWDRLGDRLGELLQDLEQQQLAGLLRSLSTTLMPIQDPARALEADSLAGYLLGATRRTWDHECQPLPAFLLDAWYALNQQVVSPAHPPSLTATWAELHPGTAMLDQPDPNEIARADERLELAQTLSTHDPKALKALGFFDRAKALLERLILALTQAANNEQLRPLCARVLSRIEELVPELASGAQSAIEIAKLVEGIERRRWWIPEDLAAPPSDELVTSGSFQREDVERVLDDL